MDIFKYLYQKFLMRDLLSFIMPGGFIVVAIIFLVRGWDFSSDSIYSLLPDVKNTSGISYIFIFGFLYVVGFALQCMGEINQIIKFHDRPCNSHNKSVPCCSECFRVHLRAYRDILNFSDKKRDIKDQHERFVVLKQMCANNALALIFSSVVVAARLLYELTKSSKFNVDKLVLLTLTFVLGCSLWGGYKRLLARQEMWEDLEIRRDD